MSDPVCKKPLNALLDKEVDELVNARKYERSNDHQGYYSGHYKRNFRLCQDFFQI